MSSVQERLLSQIEKYAPQARAILPPDSLLGEAYEVIFEENQFLVEELQKLQAKFTELVMELQQYRSMTVEKKLISQFRTRRK